jgi:hypothetical protein
MHGCCGGSVNGDWPTKIEIRPATAADVEEFYGRPPLFSMRGFVGVKDGVVIGLGGVYRMDDHYIAFSDLKPEAREHLTYVLRAAKEVIKLMNNYDEVFAYPSEAEKNAAGFLEHLGFTQCGKLYRWSKHDKGLMTWR